MNTQSSDVDFAAIPELQKKQPWLKPDIKTLDLQETLATTDAPPCGNSAGCLDY